MKVGRIEEIAAGMYQFEWCCSGCGHRLNLPYPDNNTNNNFIWYDFCPHCGKKLCRDHYVVTMDLQPDPITRMYPDYWDILQKQNLVEGDRKLFESEQLDKTTPPHVFINVHRRFVRMENEGKRPTNDIRFAMTEDQAFLLQSDSNFKETVGYFV